MLCYSILRFSLRFLSFFSSLHAAAAAPVLFLSLILSLFPFLRDLFLCSNLISFPLFHSLPNPLQILLDGYDSPPHIYYNLHPSLHSTSNGSYWLMPSWHYLNRPFYHSRVIPFNLFSALPPRVLPPSLSYSFHPYSLPIRYSIFLFNILLFNSINSYN